MTRQNPAVPDQPLRILVTALGGEGGGVLMNWLVEVARANGFTAQSTSVPGVAQRTGSTSYYAEITAADTSGGKAPVFNLMPMPGRVDILVASEMLEAARMIQAGYVSPDRTVFIASASRVYATAEKIHLADGRYDIRSVRQAAQQMARISYLPDLQQLAQENSTYISATMFGALAACGALPWSLAQSRSVLEGSSDAASLRGFDAAAAQIRSDGQMAEPLKTVTPFNAASAELEAIMTAACQRLTEYQDADYADLYRTRMRTLTDQSDVNNHQHQQVVAEAARRLANWMAYEDIARVADLKTSAHRFATVRDECRVSPDQLIRITEFLKPRPEELADMLPARWGTRLLQRVHAGKRVPLLGQGRRIASNTAWGYWLLRVAAGMRRLRRKSMRFDKEQREIESWLANLATALPRSAEFALGLAELPRVRKGYSDTLQRGLAAYEAINTSIVVPAIQDHREATVAKALTDAIGAAFQDENHSALKETVIQFRPKSEIASVHQ